MAFTMPLYPDSLFRC